MRVKHAPSVKQLLNNSIYEENTITILLFTKTTFDMKIYVDDVLFGHATGTYVYDAGEKKVTITITEVIKHPDGKEGVAFVTGFPEEPDWEVAIVFRPKQK